MECFMDSFQTSEEYFARVEPNPNPNLGGAGATYWSSAPNLGGAGATYWTSTPNLGGTGVTYWTSVPCISLELNPTLILTLVGQVQPTGSV